jgi:hypothetical protein
MAFAVVAMYATYVLFTAFKLDPLLALVPVAGVFFWSATVAIRADQSVRRTARP